MGLFSDYEVDCQFAADFPFGVPCDAWRTKSGEEIAVKDMTTAHIKNCMRLVGEDDDWYAEFAEELARRKGEGE